MHKDKFGSKGFSFGQTPSRDFNKLEKLLRKNYDVLNLKPSSTFPYNITGSLVHATPLTPELAPKTVYAMEVMSREVFSTSIIGNHYICYSYLVLMDNTQGKIKIFEETAWPHHDAIREDYLQSIYEETFKSEIICLLNTVL